MNVLSDLNDALEEVGADFKIGAELKIPAEVNLEGETVETHIRVQATEEGLDIIKPDKQVERILKEILHLRQKN